jgi:hypothetical protein
MAMSDGPKEIAENYFSHMRAGDIAVVELFAEDAELRGLGFRKQGRDQIREFYSGVIAGARPTPSPAGPILAEGNRARSTSRWRMVGKCTPSTYSRSRRGASAR